MLELVIAFFLLSICALPLVRNPLKLLKKQFSTVEVAEMSRISACEFAEIKAKLYQNAIDWEVLSKNPPAKGEKPTPDQEDKITVSLIKPTEFVRRTHFWTVSEKKGENGEELRLINIRLTFERPRKEGEKKGKKYTFNWRTFVSRGTTEKKG